MSVILVGNGESLLGSNMGEKIDSYDTVVRFDGLNIEGYEKDVGTKTDILVLDTYKFLRYMRVEFDDIRDEMYDIEEIWIIPSEEDYNFMVDSFQTDFKNLKFMYKDVETYKQTLGYYIDCDCDRAGSNYLSAELFAILNLTKKTNKLNVIGFDFLNTDINVLKHEVVYGMNELMKGYNDAVNHGYYLTPNQKFKTYFSDHYWGCEGTFSYNLEIKIMNLLGVMGLFKRKDKYEK